MERLRDVIFHERQEEGSMLCAQHCLNTLLQGSYFSAADLGEIGKQIDALEASYDEESAAHPSANMDDTGFFSVQVLENALGIWGLDLQRWRSAGMRAVQSHPENQIAFILNYQQHWYTIRRFGSMPDTPELAHGGSFHWFNLNSYLKQPEWVSSTYLGMVLQQAESDGYSTFVVTPTRPSTPLALPRCPADDVASTIPASAMSGTDNAGPSGSIVEGLEDEDMELQAALQASLASPAYHVPPSDTSYPPPIRAVENHPSDITFEGDDEELDSNYTTPPESNPAPDPLEASRLRNARMLEQMQREQYMAHQEFRQNINPRHAQQAEEEEEMLRRAIAESEAMAREGQTSTRETELVPVHQPHHATDRVYDDDDPELQAALQASLQPSHEWEEIPPHLLQLPTPLQMPKQTTPAQGQISTDDTVNDTDTASETDATTEPETDIVERDVSMEEMRRRRLARFEG